MNIIHIMADGTTRKSIEGVVIQSDQFYRVAQGIIEKRSGCAETREEANGKTM